MKIDEAADRLSRAGVPPEGVSWPDALDNRNWLTHQDDDQIDREITWATLTTPLPARRLPLATARDRPAVRIPC